MIEHEDRPEAVAGAAGDACILAFGVDADDRAIGGEQIGDDGADTLAAAGRRHGQEMRGSAVAEQLAGAEIAAEKQALRRTGEPGRLLVGREARRAMGVALPVAKIAKEGLGQAPIEGAEETERGGREGEAIGQGRVRLVEGLKDAEDGQTAGALHDEHQDRRHDKIACRIEGAEEEELQGFAGLRADGPQHIPKGTDELHAAEVSPGASVVLPPGSGRDRPVSSCPAGPARPCGASSAVSSVPAGAAPTVSSASGSSSFSAASSRACLRAPSLPPSALY